MTKFRTLRADEIDVRVGNTNRDKTKANLLLYKDARCDMAVLDECVGPMNWQRSHSRENANCTVSIWDAAKTQWISKEDTGTESRTEAEKGLASDSFKRACTCWGIGRELYTAPQIWVPYTEKKYEKYTVAEIGYNENREINRLAIADKSGIVIFRYGGSTKQYVDIKTEPPPDDAVAPGDAAEIAKDPWNPLTAYSKWIAERGVKPEEFARLRSTLVGAGYIADQPLNQMTEAAFRALTDTMLMVYPEKFKEVKP